MSDREPEAQLSEEQQDEKSPGELVLIGKIRDMLVGLPIEQIKGVDRVEAATPLPGTPDFIAGLVYVRGGIEAGVDLGVIFGKEELVVTDQTRVVLFEADGGRGAIMFDELLDMPRLRPEEIVPLKLSNIPKAPVLGQFTWREETVIMVSPAGLYKYAIDFEM